MTEVRNRIIVEKFPASHVARITLNRPEKRNAIDAEMMAELTAALEEIRADSALQVVVTKANGPAFCSGMDLTYIRALLQSPTLDWERSSPPRILAETFREFPKVTIAQVQGYCVGGGLGLMLSHDIAIAADSARIGMPDILRGSFGQIGTALLFHAGVASKKATMLQLSGRNVTGAEADRMGLVSQAVAEAELESFTQTLAEEIGSRAPAALAAAKIAVKMGSKLSLPDAAKLDTLVGAWQQLLVDPMADVENYLASQSGGANPNYRRPER